MKKRIIAIAALMALVLTLFAACGEKEKKTVTAQEAQQIALKALSLTAQQVDDVHVHVTKYNGVDCYQIHITDNDHEHTLYIDQTGKILNPVK